MQMVLRIFDDELDSNLERTFGPNSAFSSSALAAPTLAVAAVSRNIAHVLPLSDVVLGIAEVTIARNSKLTGFASYIEDNYDVRFLQWLNSDGQWCWPHEGLRLEGDDVVLLMGTIDTLERVRQENIQSSKFDFLQAEKLQRPTDQFNKVIVCGLGKVGYRVVKELCRQKPRPEVVVICGSETHRPFIEELERSGIRIIQGDARIPETLVDAGIEQAYSVAAVTSDNLCNIHIGLTARRIRSTIDLVVRVLARYWRSNSTVYLAHTQRSVRRRWPRPRWPPQRWSRAQAMRSIWGGGLFRRSKYRCWRAMSLWGAPSNRCTRKRGPW
jgi:Trk K+ transport system NAD-binding subunit